MHRPGKAIRRIHTRGTEPGYARGGTGFGLEELEPRLLLSGDLTFGIDVSHWNGSINWASVAAADKEFAYIKATQGTTFTDNKFITNINGATNAGVLASGYHFATPYTGGVNDAADEAAFFYSVISPYVTDGYLRPVLDFEGGLGEFTKAEMTSWVHDFMAAFTTISGGVVPIIYSGNNYSNNAFLNSVAIYDLWFARWPATPDFDNPPTGAGPWGSNYDIWQYSATDSVSGISGNVDGDVYFGNINEMVAKFGIHTLPDDHGDARPEATAVAVPSTTAGVIGALGDSDWFELTLDGNTDYMFSVLTDGLVSAELRLYSETGTLLLSDSGPDSGGGLAELPFYSNVPGTYYVSVDSSGSGGYELTVQEADEHGDSIGDSTGLAAVALGGLQTESDKDYFHFTAAAGANYSFELFSMGLQSAVLDLYHSGGGLVRQAVGSTVASPMIHIDWTAPADGDMYLAVKSFSSSSGDYLLAMAEADPPLAGDLDGDGFVGISDLNVVLGNWNQNVTQGDLLSGDPSDDGFVGIDDLNIVLGNWNAGTPPLASESASEAESQASSVAEVAAPVRSEAARGLAIANWRDPERSAFGQEEPEGYTPAFGLWEYDNSVA